MSGGTPSSLSWRVGRSSSVGGDSPRASSEQQPQTAAAATQPLTSNSSPSVKKQHNTSSTSSSPSLSRSHTTSAIASALLPTISIGQGFRTSSSSSSSISYSDDDRERGGGEKGGGGVAQNGLMENHHHSSHGVPFFVGPLKQNERKSSSSTSGGGGGGGDGSNNNNNTGGGGSSGARRVRKRDRFAQAGRSLSPFRHSRSHDRSSSLSRLPSYLASTLSHSGSSSAASSVAANASKKLLAPRAAGGDSTSASTSTSPSGNSASPAAGETTDASEVDDTDTDSVSRGGVYPRNTAFRDSNRSDGRGRSDSNAADSDWDDLSDVAPGETGASPSRGGGGVGDDDHTGGETTDDDDAAAGRADDEEDVPEDDPLLDFDDATIDNTLFNAGCLDLHNAWQHNKESIGEGGWYPPDDHKAWYEEDDAEGDEAGGAEAATSTAPTAADYGLMQQSEEPEGDAGDASGDATINSAETSPSPPDGYAPSKVRLGPLDGTAPTSPPEDHSARLPNVILPSTFRPREPRRQGSKWVFAGGPSGSGSKSSSSANPHSLVASRPEFAKNRCTITLVHGEYDAAVARRGNNTRGPKKWIVASDGSAESSYAIEWTIGTVLRDGDETLIVSVMETSEKLDPSGPAGKHLSSAAKAAMRENQEIRQDMATRLARQATSLLLRTRLAVKISCQALHAKHARHMLLDLIDFYEPTMVIVGSRGLGSLKNILLGSTSHYLVQKSSKPVMIARKRLQLPALPRGKSDVVSSVRRRHMRLDEAAIEKKSKVAEEEGDAEDGGSESEHGEHGENGQRGERGDDGDGDTESKRASSNAALPPPDADALPTAPDPQAVGAQKLRQNLDSAAETPSPEVLSRVTSNLSLNSDAKNDAAAAATNATDPPLRSPPAAAAAAATHPEGGIVGEEANRDRHHGRDDDDDDDDDNVAVDDADADDESVHETRGRSRSRSLSRSRSKSDR